MTAYVNVNGETVIDVDLHVPNHGPWWADVVFESAPDLSGRVTLTIGDLTLSGTFSQNGTFGLQRRGRIVAGGAGWGSVIPKQHYHNDAMINPLRIAQDAARLAGEQIGSFNPSTQSIGVDYVRESGLASRVLEDIIGGVPWYVDYQGITQVGARQTSTPNVNSYEVLEYDPRNKLAIIAADSLSTISVGSIISKRMDEPQTITEMEIRVTADVARIVGYCGGTLLKKGRLVQAFTSMVKAVTDNKLFGKYRYRVIRMAPEPPSEAPFPRKRVELQAVSNAANLPDILPIAMRPGVSGMSANLAIGSIVLVEFIEGDRTLPIITAFAGVEEPGHIPTSTFLSVATSLHLGSINASEGVLPGDSFKSWADAHQHGYLSGPSGTAALTTPPTTTPDGSVPDPSPSPSSKVKVAL